MDWERAIHDVRERAISTVETLLTTAAQLELPTPPKVLSDAGVRLRENQYQVLIVGETSRGKSSFVNALIGRDILPTDVDVATCQVFRVARADQEAFRLRLEDDSTQDIGLTDLPKYGSQVVADVEGTPTLSEIIRWIEVDVPVKFLPEGVSLLDTPGVGALYAAHAQITHRFVPRSDAVIVVLDSEGPIKKEEIEFVEALLEHTRSLFFIQTKIDMFGKSHWEEILKRNQEILNKQFRDILPDCRVWPISSKNLRKAAATGDDDYLMVSRHRQLAAVLKLFLFRVAGWGRTAETAYIADEYHRTASQTLAARQAAVADKSKQVRAEIHQQIARNKTAFDEVWGPRGKKRQELLDEVAKCTKFARGYFQQALQPGGLVEEEQLELINQLTTIEDARSLNDVLAANTVNSAATKWREIERTAYQKCSQLLVPFIAASESIISTPSAVLREFQSSEILNRKPVIRGEFMDRLVKARMGFATMGMVGGVAGGLLSALGIVAPPVAIGAAVVCSLYGLAKGFAGAADAQLRTAQQDLHRHLQDVMKKLRQFYFHLDLDSQKSYVDGILDGMREDVRKHIESTASRKSEEAQTEIGRLRKESELNSERRKEEAARLNKHASDWAKVHIGLKELGQKLEELDQRTSGPS